MDVRRLSEEAGIGEALQVGAQLVLVPPGDQTGSRLGEPVLVPAGARRPRDRRGRPPNFLAGIRLDEMPGFDERELLPAGGWMLAFADLDNANAEGFVDHARNEEGSVARLLFADDVREAPFPEDLTRNASLVLRARPVTGRPVLTIPDDDEAAERFGHWAAVEACASSC